MDDGGSPSLSFMQKLKLGLGRKNVSNEDVAEEIISMVNEGHEQGVLEENEAEMIHNIFQLGEKEAKDIMTHRKNIVALDDKLSLREAIQIIIENQNSRYPVYDDTIDNIIGVLHIKEALSASQNQENLEKKINEIKGLVRKVPLIPETRSINSLFSEMQSQKNHMVIVVDEYGQTAGIVAMEDILEEIVGNILDEHDVEQQDIEKISNSCYRMNGMARLEDVFESLELEFEDDEEEYDTLNGWLISKMDQIPVEGETYRIVEKGYIFQVLSVKDKMIENVKVTRDDSCKKD